MLSSSTRISIHPLSPISLIYKARQVSKVGMKMGKDQCSLLGKCPGMDCTNRDFEKCWFFITLVIEKMNGEGLFSRRKLPEARTVEPWNLSKRWNRRRMIQFIEYTKRYTTDE